MLAVGLTQHRPNLLEVTWMLGSIELLTFNFLIAPTDLILKSNPRHFAQARRKGIMRKGKLKRL